MQKKNTTPRHELSERHFKQIIRRPAALRRKLFPIWAVTWRPGGNSGSFLDKLFRPLGSPTMMTQVSYAMEGNREGIGLFGVAAQVVPQGGVVAYEDCRLQHEFHRVPFVGARGTILDPSPDRRGTRGNGSWVQLALEVDRVRQRATQRNFLLPSAPTLPEIYFGYGSKESATYQVSEALIAKTAGDIDVTWEGNGLHNLDTQKTAAQRAAFDKLDPNVRDVWLRDTWESSFISPKDPMNSTGLWLLPHSMSTDVYRATRVFEYFGGLVGAHVFNPARKLTGRVVEQNPALEVAKEAGVDLAAVLAELETVEGDDDPRMAAAEAIMGSLLPAYRARLQASSAISDQDLLAAMCSYNAPVAVEPAVAALSEADQILEMRHQLRPHISECCTDEDILFAVQNPNGPLMAAGLCTIQCLHRDPRVPLAEALRFGPSELGRERVTANLWYDLPQGGKPKSQSQPTQVQHAA